jgi:hypothetical protein
MDVYKELGQVVEKAYDKYVGLDDDITSIRVSPKEWSLKEIIGHLVDSASNNHQRFIRLQLVSQLEFPGYGKDNWAWLELSKYNELGFRDILLLWKQYNILIMNIIKNVKKETLDNFWTLDGVKYTLKELIVDYVRHLKEHLEQFDKTLEELRKT